MRSVAPLVLVAALVLCLGRALWQLPAAEQRIEAALVPGAQDTDPCADTDPIFGGPC